MKTALISAIEVTDRQRKEIMPKELLELKRSIAARGLIHPPLLSVHPDGTFKLVAGERRLRAMQELHEEGVNFTFDSTPVPMLQIPYTQVSDLAPLDLMELELEENILRANLTWLEEAEAKSKIHELRLAQNPKQTIKETAAEIASIKNDPSTTTTSYKQLAQAITIAKHKDDPVVANAKNASQAYKNILGKMEAEMKAKLAAANVNFKPKHILIKGDCREVMKNLQPGYFDILFSDPPYGINADTAKKDSKHYYDDSPTNALDIYQHIIAKGFHLTKPKASLLLWCDIDHFLILREFAAAHGWTCWRCPLIYYKGESGHAPWGRAGFIRTYEILLYAVKGQKELYAPGGTDVKQYSSIVQSHRRNKIHAAEKPVALLSHFLSLLGLEGHTVLDPCCGSGAIFPAAEERKLVATGIELDDHYYNVASSRLSALSDPEESDEDLDDDDDGELPISLTDL
jgi:site-specific DNA-methyltransferase (adenine-specific)/modification methylase